MTSDAGFRFDTSARDLGLLVLRFAVGAAILQAGLLKAFDYQMVVESMEQSGWRMPQLAAFMVTASETLGGIGLLLGIVTPLAGMAVTAAMIDAWAVNVAGMAFWSQPFNLPFMIGLGAVALLLTGAGTYSLDERLWGRATWPRLVSITLLIVAIAAAVATWVMLNGTNPIHLTTPAS
jgi:putative oxidoreductase